MAARGDPSDRAVGQDDAILRLVGTARLQHLLDRRRTHGAVVGMDPSCEVPVVERFTRLETEELPAFVGHP